MDVIIIRCFNGYSKLKIKNLFNCKKSCEAGKIKAHIPKLLTFQNACLAHVFVLVYNGAFSTAINPSGIEHF